MTIPTDPLYAQQWHFDLLGNGRGRSLLERVWNEFTGAGIHVGVYDNGIENTHPDLDGNYDSAREVSINGTRLPVQSFDAHGTAVAGIIASERNGLGGVGIAFGASITSVNVLEPDPVFADKLVAYAGMQRFDVVNHSWGYPSDFFTGDLPDISQILAQYALASELGRGGKGTVIVQSAGNDTLDANGNGLNTSRYTITVAALLDTGGVAAYSNHGASVLVSAPAGAFGSSRITTTDLTGGLGYDQGNFTDQMSGTSAAAPMVSATAALMLDANPNLGWRDVQSILALTAFHTGADFGSLGPNELFGQVFNNARNWNGGGHHISFDYGFGNIDPFGAVRMAEAFGVMGAASQRSANELTSSASFSPSLPLLDGSHFTTFNVASNPLTVEHMEVTLTITHPDFSNLTIFLLSPSGTFAPLATTVTGIDASAGFTWVFGSEAFRGEQSTGTWTLQVTDNVTGNTGLLSQFKVDFYGGAPDGSADTYHFTDEFAEMKTRNAARGTLADLDGGIDWINAAAVSTGSSINLNGGIAGSIDGSVFTIAAGTVIENAIAGDGNDVLTGNGVGNRLHGMRGNDTLVGGGGDDQLDGGAGSDSMTGGGGNDTYSLDANADATIEIAGGGIDTVRASITHMLRSEIENLTLIGAAKIDAIGNTLANTLIGNAAANLLDGGVGIDVMIGNGGSDIYVVDVADDITTETSAAGGIDLVLSFVTRTLGGNLENLTLIGLAENGTGNTLGNILTGNVGANRLDGGAGHDKLDGGAGSDVMIGGRGNDTYVVNVAGDITTETSASDGVDLVLSGVTRTLGTYLENLTLTGSAANGFGNALANVLTGNGSTNQLDGGTGDDKLSGQASNDTLIGGSGNDTLTGGLGRDIMTGGVGADDFDFNSLSETGNTSSTRDQILDFQRLTDDIDLSTIDASRLMAGNNGFVFRGTGSFTTSSVGEVRYVQVTASDYTIVYIDNDADTSAEAQIYIKGLVLLSSSDFIL